MQLFNRIAACYIGTKNSSEIISLEGLRITFDITKTKTIMPNTAKITIYNLSENTRSKIKDRESFILIRAGYKDDIGLQDIYKGTILRVTHEKKPPEVLTVIEAQDGILQMQAKVSLGYPSETSAKRVLSDIVNQMGINKKSDIINVDDKVFGGGFSTVGTAKDALNRVTKYLGLEWSIQDSEIKFVKIGDSDSKSPPLISIDTGMIESPVKVANVMPAVDMYTYQGKGFTPQISGSGSIQFMAAGWKIKCLLMPTLEPKSKIGIKSAMIKENTLFIIETVKHNGDTHGGEWHTEIDVYEARA